MPTPTYPAGAGAVAVPVTWTVTLPAGGVVVPWFYQDSGAVLVVSSQSFTVQRLP